MDETILEIEGLAKSFRSYWTFRPIPAVTEINLSIYRGESFGFLGHNGAGKTTAIKCIVGLIHKTAGSIRLNGEELTSPEQRAGIGYLPEHPYFYDHLRVDETLDFFAALYGIEPAERSRRVMETLERVGLGDRGRSSVRSLSKGLQQRLGLAQAIINQPKLLLLDEPFSGLDPIGRMEVRELILQLRAEGTTIFMSSHILSDVEDICDRVSIMARGRLEHVFDLHEAPELFGERFELGVIDHSNQHNLEQTILKHATECEIRKTAQGDVVLAHFDKRETAESAMQQALNNGITVTSFRNAGLTLEEVFMQITEQATEKADDEDLRHSTEHLS